MRNVARRDWHADGVLSARLFDSLLHALVLRLLRSLLTKPHRFFIELSRLKRGCCISYRYELGYDFLRGCPKCIWRRSP